MMISLTNEITIYFFTLAKEPQINLKSKKNCWHLILRQGLKDCLKFVFIP